MAQQIDTNAQANAAAADEKIEIPITEPSEGDHRKIPKVIFVDNTEAWVEKYGEDRIFEQMNELYQKYKFMEGQLVRNRENMKVKLPEIKKTLEAVALLYTRH